MYTIEVVCLSQVIYLASQSGIGLCNINPESEPSGMAVAIMHDCEQDPTNLIGVLAMNRAFTYEALRKTNPLHRPARQLRKEAADVLREVAYVLQLTRRVKEQILAEEEETVLANSAP
jgi:hypothetical protein